MAIYNGRILMRKGNEADFDPSKLMSGEWAVSLDKGIVRICLEAGKVIRMATYEAFEEDMKQVEAILLECQSIEEAVRRINTEVSEKLNACAEYVQQAKGYSEQAKQYRDESLQFRNEAEQFAPEGYAELKEQVNENTFKIDTVIAKADLGIKETASGEEIHLTDSAEGKALEYALFGKATQDGEPTPENPQEIEVSGASYNLLENKATSKEENGISFVVEDDGSVTVNGKLTSNQSQLYMSFVSDYTGMVVLTGASIDDCHMYAWNNELNQRVYADETKTTLQTNNQGSLKELPFYVEKGKPYEITIRISSTSFDFVNHKVYPMIRKATVKNDRYMPYGKGSVEVKSVGKNLLKNTATSQTVNDVTFTVNNDGSVTINGTAKANTQLVLARLTKKEFKKGSYIISNGNPRSDRGGRLFIDAITEDTNTFIKGVGNTGTTGKATVNIDYVGYSKILIGLYCNKDISFNNETFYPMISKEDGEYQPYKEINSYIPTPNGLAGIPVASGGNYTDQNGQQWICDEVVKFADGSGKYIQRIKKAVLNGSEKWTLSGIIGVNGFYSENAISDGVTNVSPMLCDMFTTTLEANANMKDNQIKHGASAGNMASFLYLKTSKAETVEELKAFLSENNVTCYYILATPIETPLTAEELAEISTFYPVTNISNDFDCGMKVKYNCDSKNYIDKHLAEMEKAREQAMMSMFLLLPEETQATMIENDVNNLLTESEN